MDGFIDKIITITVYDKHWIDRAKSAALLVIHTLFRQLKPSEPLKQDNPLSLRRLAVEGQLSKENTCLGWDINNHSLRVSLPEYKQSAWTNDIKEALASTKINTDKLESLIGNLNHAAHVIPPARYFLNRLRHLLKRGKKWGPQRLQIWHRQDLQLWMKFLQHVTIKGAPINNIVFVKPSVTLCYDTREFGIGGYIKKWPSMEMYNPCSMAWETHVEPPRIPSISSDHIHDHPANGTGVPHLGIHIQFKRTVLDAQIIL